MLADHIESEILRFLNIEFQGFVRRRGVKTVRPPALVQWSELKEILPVQRHQFYAVPGFSDGDFPHSRIAFHAIEGHLAAQDADVQAVQIRRIRAQQLHVGDGEGHRDTRGGIRPGDDPYELVRLVLRRVADPAVQQRDPDNIAFPGSGHRNGHVDHTIVNVGNRVIIFHAGSGNGFHPHALPNARDSCIPNSTGVRNLFSARLEVIVRGIRPSTRVFHPLLT